jgi:endonuclease-3
MKKPAVTAATKRRLKEIHDLLYARFGDCGCPLVHASPFQLLAAVMLSAQCRDDRVNQVTQELFTRYPDAAAMAAADPEAVAEIIRPCGLFRHKSKNLVGAAQAIMTRHAGIVPQDLEALAALPGVGRKSANVILGNAFDIPGFPVDTHVKRVLNRLGVVASDSPEKIEAVVNAAVPPELWTNFSHLLIQHGRRTCHARKPDCAACELCKICPHGS